MATTLNTCGCRLAQPYYRKPEVREIKYCPMHAQAPEMAKALAELIRAAQTVPILKEPGWTVRDVADALPMLRALETAAILLRAIEEG